MKKTATWAAGFILSGLMIATIYAEPNEGFGTQETETLQGVRPGTNIQTVPKVDTLSKRNKAMLALAQAARTRRAVVQSETVGILMKKEDGLSRRNKARLKQTEEARKRQEIILTGLSPPVPD